MGLILAEQASNDLAVTIWTAIISACVSALVSWLVALWTIKGDEKRAIREGVTRIIEWAIEYPFLESDEFCDSWPHTNRQPEDNARYENFCCHVFNQIEHAWELFNGDELKMRSVLWAAELISRHKKWWESDGMNEKAYAPAFRQFVASIIRRLDKEGKPHG